MCGKSENTAAFAEFSSAVGKSCLWTFPRSVFFHSPFTHRYCYRAVFLSVLVVMLLAIPLAAQLPTGTILGVVKDASGGVVPGATITATNVDNAQARTATSGSDGAFRFSSMPVGHYNIRIEASGFKTSMQTGLVLDVATEVTVNPVLEVGSAAQEVTVTGEAPLVNTSTSSLGGLVNEQQMADLPLNGR